jgi:hypothetical protein
MTTSISDAELEALIAGLNNTPAPAAAAENQAPAEPRCTVTELLVDQCAHCRPAPTAAQRAESTFGPWFSATYRGSCSSCGSRFEEFDDIRADGEGGWLADCCGHIEPGDGVGGLVEDQQSGTSAPAVPPATRPVKDGPPASTVTELRQVLIDFEAQRPRSMQKALGPSELGTPCQQQMARKLAGAPRRPITDPTWAPFIGTAVHASMADEVVPFWNAQLGYERWLAEDRLVVDPGIPGLDGQLADGIEGNGDAFDQDYGAVVDWKLVGKTALEKLRRGIRMNKPPAEQISVEYRVQGHLYGIGHQRKGRDVRYVRIVLLARSHDYDESAEWTEEFKPEIAVRALDRYWQTHDLLAALDVANEPDFITAVPAAPSRDACKWCPFFRPGQASGWEGCAGDQPLDKVVANASKGLIEP